MCNYCFVVLTIPLCLVIVNKFYSILFYSYKTTKIAMYSRDFVVLLIIIIIIIIIIFNLFIEGSLISAKALFCLRALFGAARTHSYTRMASLIRTRLSDLCRSRRSVIVKFYLFLVLAKYKGIYSKILLIGCLFWCKNS